MQTVLFEADTLLSLLKQSNRDTRLSLLKQSNSHVCCLFVFQHHHCLPSTQTTLNDITDKQTDRQGWTQNIEIPVQLQWCRAAEYCQSKLRQINCKHITKESWAHNKLQWRNNMCGDDTGIDFSAETGITAQIECLLSHLLLQQLFTITNTNTNQ